MSDTAGEWRELVLACVENGDDLRDDATLLLEAGRYARALSLAVLSSEEYGKAIHALAVINAGGSEEERRAFDRTYRSHQPKLVAAALWAAVVDPAVNLDDEFRERLMESTRTAAGRKMDGFYVDRGTRGSVTRPSESVSGHDAHEYISLASTLASHLRQVLNQLDTPEKFELAWEYGPQVSQMIAEIAAAQQASPEVQLQALRGLLPQYGITPLLADPSSARADGVP